MSQVKLSENGLWVMTATILASSIAFLSTSAVNVALNTIQQSLGASATELLWIVNIYLLMLASFILVGGSLGDRFGRNRIFGTGVGIFAAASLVSALAPSPLVLILARTVQGIGGALMVPGSLAIITATIRAEDRGQAIGIWSASSAITTMIGPVLGGFLADAGLWRGIFLINLPLALAVLVALPRVPETRDENAAQQIDYAGAFFLAASLGAITYGALTLGEIGQFNQQALLAIGAIIAGLLLLGVFVVIERRSDHPMVNFKLFESQTFTGTNIMTAFLYAGLGGVLLLLPLNLIQVQDYSDTAAGFASLPVSLMLAILSPIMGRVLHRTGPKPLLTIGPFLAGVGFVLLMLPGVTGGTSDYWTSFLPALVVLGLGIGITVAPLTTTVMSAVSSEFSGTASGINNAVTRTAQALATGLLGAVLIFVFSAALQGRVDDLSLAEDVQTTIIERTDQLANLQPPDALDDATTTEVNQAVNQAFVDAFRLAVGICAVLAFLSAGMTQVFVESGVLQET